MNFVSGGSEVIEYANKVGGLVTATNDDDIVQVREIRADGVSAPREISSKAPSKPLYEQLAERKAQADAILREKNNPMNHAPRALDEEDAAFLDEQLSLEHQRDRAEAEREEHDRIQFQLAKAARSNLNMTNSSLLAQAVADSASAGAGSYLEKYSGDGSPSAGMSASTSAIPK